MKQNEIMVALLIGMVYIVVFHVIGFSRMLDSVCHRESEETTSATVLSNLELNSTCEINPSLTEFVTTKKGIGWVVQVHPYG